MLWRNSKTFRVVVAIPALRRAFSTNSEWEILSFALVAVDCSIALNKVLP